MTYSGASASPAVGTVGTKTTVTLSGSHTAVYGANTSVVYAYIQSAPPNSKLPTLDQLAVLVAWNAGLYTGAYTGPLARGVDRKELRLVSDAAGVTFTPDVPGLFTVRFYDVEAYRFIPHYQGHVPGTGELAETDNELAALPAYAGSSAQSSSATLAYYVKETHKRTIGAGLHTATVTVSGYADAPDPYDTNAVTLAAGTSSLAKLAALDNDVLAALLTLKQTTGSALTTWTIGSFNELFDAFNAHLGLVGDQTIHTVADNTNILAVGACTDVATAISLLNDMRTKYAAHRVMTAGTVHVGADNTNVVTAAACADFGTARTLFADLRDRMFYHAFTYSTIHITAGDGTAFEWLEVPYPGSVAHMVAQCNRLANFYTNHIRRVIQHSHFSGDANNTIVGVNFESNDGTAASLNLLADALTRHIANQKADGSAAGVAYHQTAGVSQSSNNKIPLRANGNDPGSIQLVAEWIAYTLELHALSISPHRQDAQWGRYPTTTFFSDSYLARLTKAWLVATSSPNANAPDFQSAIAGLAQKGWG